METHISPVVQYTNAQIAKNDSIYVSGLFVTLLYSSTNNAMDTAIDVIFT